MDIIPWTIRYYALDAKRKPQHMAYSALSLRRCYTHYNEESESVFTYFTRDSISRVGNTHDYHLRAR